MQIGRLFEIVYLLQNKKTVTARELAERFEVSTRTIYRDLDYLGQAGIPIYTSKGRGGGIGLVDNFVLNKAALSPSDRSEILTALQTLDAVRLPDAKPVLSRLSALFGDTDASWIQVDFSDWGERRQDTLVNIRRAIQGRRLLEFDYYSSHGEKCRRTVEPLQLWFKHKAWYLKAWCRLRGDFRLFKLTRITSLTVLEEPFTPKPETEQEQASFQPGSPVLLRMRIDASQSYRVYDEFEEEQIEIQQDGSYLVSQWGLADEWTYGFLLSYGPSLEIIEPDEFRREIKKRLANTLARYG